MKEVDLYTEKADYVCTAQIPPFMPGHDPEVLMWGSRVFQRENDYYREVFGGVVVLHQFKDGTGSIGPKKDEKGS